MFDCYHVQRTEGDLTRRLTDLLPLVGHIQFAGVPDRSPPDRGEVDYAHVFQALAALGYRALWLRNTGPAARPDRPWGGWRGLLERPSQPGGGLRWTQGRARSRSAQSDISRSSSPNRAAKCTPMGTPSCDQCSGTEAAGCPEAFAVAVNGE